MLSIGRNGFGVRNYTLKSINNNKLIHKSVKIANHKAKKHYTNAHHTSYIIHHTSYIIHHTSYIIHHTSYIIHHTNNKPLHTESAVSLSHYTLFLYSQNTSPTSQYQQQQNALYLNVYEYDAHSCCFD